VVNAAQLESPAPASPQPRRRRLVLVVGSIAVLVAGIVTTLAVTFHYRDAPSLTNSGGSYGWGPPDNLQSRFVYLGRYTGLVAPARPGYSQSFYVEVRNDSSVTQTILGLHDDGAGLPQREHLDVSTTDDYRVSQDQLTYRSGPISLPPHTSGLSASPSTPRGVPARGSSPGTGCGYGCASVHSPGPRRSC